MFLKPGQTGGHANAKICRQPKKLPQEDKRFLFQKMRRLTLPNSRLSRTQSQLGKKPYSLARRWPYPIPVTANGVAAVELRLMLRICPWQICSMILSVSILTCRTTCPRYCRFACRCWRRPVSGPRRFYRDWRRCWPRSREWRWKWRPGPAASKPKL